MATWSLWQKVVGVLRSLLNAGYEAGLWPKSKPGWKPGSDLSPKF